MAGQRVYLYRDDCTACLRAADWLRDRGAELQERHLIADMPTRTEIEGLVRGEGSVAELVDPGHLGEIEGMSSEEITGYLATDPGRLAHPVALVGNRLFVGFGQDLRDALS